MVDLSDISLLIIDLDNTLCDTQNTLSQRQWDHVAQRLRDSGKAGIARQLLERFGKQGFVAAIKDLEIADDLRKEMVAWYDENPIDSLALFPDAHAILDLPMQKVLLTRGEEALQNRKIDHLGIREYFLEIRIVKTFDEKTRYLDQIMRTHKRRPEECLSVGDRIVEEIKDAAMLGMRTAFLCRPGCHVPACDVEPTVTVSSLTELADILQQR